MKFQYATALVFPVGCVGPVGVGVLPDAVPGGVGVLISAERTKSETGSDETSPRKISKYVAAANLRYQIG